jgi:gamma-glutamylcysteine synthetase
MSQSHKRYFEVAPLSSERLQFFKKSVNESHQQQQQIEAEDDMNFAEFMRAYESSRF